VFFLQHVITASPYVTELATRVKARKKLLVTYLGSAGFPGLAAARLYAFRTTVDLSFSSAIVQYWVSVPGPWSGYLSILLCLVLCSSLPSWQWRGGGIALVEVDMICTHTAPCRRDRPQCLEVYRPTDRYTPQNYIFTKTNSFTGTWHQPRSRPHHDHDTG
jgi:hypothetical protein